MTKIIRGAVTRVAGAYDTLVTKTIAISFPAQAIHQQRLACLEVLIQNDPTSQSNIAVGNVFEQHVVLTPGAHIIIPINDASYIYAGTAVGGAATVNWIAMT